MTKKNLLGIAFIVAVALVALKLIIKSSTVKMTPASITVPTLSTEVNLPEENIADITTDNDLVQEDKKLKMDLTGIATGFSIWCSESEQLGINFEHYITMGEQVDYICTTNVQTDNITGRTHLQLIKQNYVIESYYTASENNYITALTVGDIQTGWANVNNVSASGEFYNWIVVNTNYTQHVTSAQNLLMEISYSDYESDTNHFESHIDQYIPEFTPALLSCNLVDMEVVIDTLPNSYRITVTYQYEDSFADSEVYNFEFIRSSDYSLVPPPEVEQYSVSTSLLEQVYNYMIKEAN